MTRGDDGGGAYSRVACSSCAMVADVNGTRVLAATNPDFGLVTALVTVGEEANSFRIGVAAGNGCTATKTIIDDVFVTMTTDPPTTSAPVYGDVVSICE